MKSIEKSLHKYFNGVGPKISVQEISIYATEHGDDLINTLFKILNNTLDFYTGDSSLEPLHDAFKYINIIIANAEKLNRTYLSRRLVRLTSKIETIKEERKNKFCNPEKAIEELDKLLEKINEIYIENEKKENKQFEFISYLINEPQNIAYIEYTLKKIPHIVNIRDKNNVSLYHTVIRTFLDTLGNNDEEKTMYYLNLISLIQHQKQFKIDDHEKREILAELYKELEWMSCNKKAAKKNREKIHYVSIVRDMLKKENIEVHDIEDIAVKYNVPIYFDQDITGAVTLIQEPISLENYPDRTEEDDYIITIDGKDAVEIDDALSCKRLDNGNYLLGVHIASVLGYFPYYSGIVEEAFARNHSIYLQHQYQDKKNDFNRVVPIFPYEFSANKASLLEGEPRLARSYYFEINPKGEVVNQRFSKSIITSNKKTSYQEVNHIIRKGCEDKKLEETVKNLYAVTTYLDNKYKSSPLYETMKISSSNHAELKVKKKGAENIVYQAMLLTGARVAEFFVKLNYPCLLRVHASDQETDDRTEEMINVLLDGTEGSKYERIANLVDSIYPKGTYDTEGRHDGLNLDCYCHCTSSLRRAQDILIEHALEVCYDNEPTEEELIELSAEIEKRKHQINSRTRPIDWFAQEYNRTYCKKKVR